MIKEDVGEATNVKGDMIHNAIMFVDSVGSFDLDIRNSRLGISILPFGAATAVAAKQQHSLYSAIIRGNNVFTTALDVTTSIIEQKKEILDSTILPAEAIVALVADDDIVLPFEFPPVNNFGIHAGIAFGLLEVLLLVH